MKDWERAKGYYQSRVLAEIQNDGGDPIKKGVDVSGDPILEPAKKLYELRRKHRFNVERELLAIYENKPFGLPLSEQDRKDRDYVKQEFDKETPK